jgi:HEAT repeat protein
VDRPCLSLAQFSDYTFGSQFAVFWGRIGSLLQAELTHSLAFMDSTVSESSKVEAEEIVLPEIRFLTQAELDSFVRKAATSYPSGHPS